MPDKNDTLLPQKPAVPPLGSQQELLGQDIVEVRVRGSSSRLETIVVFSAIAVISLVTVGLVKIRAAWPDAGRSRATVSQTPPIAPAGTAHVRVGITRVAYYSWVANIGEGVAEVVPIAPSSVYHHYEPSPQDIEKLHTVQLLVYDNVGDDEFVAKMIPAAANPQLRLVDLHKGVVLLPFFSRQTQTSKSAGAEKKHKALPGVENDDEHETPGTPNPHTYISIDAAITQIYNIRDALVQSVPVMKAQLDANTDKYVRQLRIMKAAAIELIKDAPEENKNIATAHDAYIYLFNDLGLRLADVFEPAEAISPSASELAGIIDRLKQEHVKAILLEADVQNKYGAEVARTLGLRTYPMRHMTGGEYTPGRFTEDMLFDLGSLVAAVTGRERAEAEDAIRKRMMEAEK